MSTPDPYDEGHIADTGMFKRFVEHEQEMDATPRSSGTGRWVAIAAIIAIVVIAVVVWLLTR